jgi:hypothetical protein
MVVARWDGALDLERARAILDGHQPPAEVVDDVVIAFVESS